MSSPNFVADTKMIFGYNFGAPLKENCQKVNPLRIKVTKSSTDSTVCLWIIAKFSSNI